MKNKSLKKGFTIIELLVVIAIIGLLSTTVAPKVFSAMRKAKVAEVQHTLGVIRSRLSIDSLLEEYPDLGKENNEELLDRYNIAFTEAFTDSDGNAHEKTNRIVEGRDNGGGWFYIREMGEIYANLPNGAYTKDSDYEIWNGTDEPLDIDNGGSDEIRNADAERSAADEAKAKYEEAKTSYEDILNELETAKAASWKNPYQNSLNSLKLRLRQSESRLSYATTQKAQALSDKNYSRNVHYGYERKVDNAQAEMNRLHSGSASYRAWKRTRDYNQGKLDGSGTGSYRDYENKKRILDQKTRALTTETNTRNSLRNQVNKYQSLYSNAENQHKIDKTKELTEIQGRLDTSKTDMDNAKIIWDELEIKYEEAVAGLDL